MRVFVAYPKPARMRTFVEEVEPQRDAAKHQREARGWQHGVGSPSADKAVETADVEGIAAK